MEDALSDAYRMLGEHQDEVDAQAAVTLATYLHSTAERERFLERRYDEDLPIGGGTTH